MLLGSGTSAGVAAVAFVVVGPLLLAFAFSRGVSWSFVPLQIFHCVLGGGVNHLSNIRFSKGFSFL